MRHLPPLQRSAVQQAAHRTAQASADSARELVKKEKELPNLQGKLEGADQTKDDGATVDHAALVGKIDDVAKAMSQVSTATATSTSSKLCNSKSKGVKPPLLSALKRAVAAQQATLTAAERVRKQLEQKKPAKQQQALTARLKELKDAAARQAEIVATLRQALQEVTKLKACS